MRQGILALVTLLALTCAALAAPQHWYQGLDFAATERALETSPIVRIRTLKDFLESEYRFRWQGSNQLFLLELAGGTRAVFRTEDMPWGSTAEVSGYRFARALGSRLVPPTVRRVLQRGAGVPGWAWPTASRLGSLQLFVEAAGHPHVRDLLTPKERSDVEVISFVFGRYDTHPGNLLIDPSGAPVMIDFEVSMNLQQSRYGEVPFVQHGGRLHTADALPRTTPFPFDHPRVLTNPTLAEVRRIFGPWWRLTWPAGMDMLHRMAQQAPGKRIPYVIWDDMLWVQLDVPARHPAHTDVYSRETLRRLEALSIDRFTSEILSPEYHASHVLGFLDRRRQLLAAAAHGTLIP